MPHSSPSRSLLALARSFGRLDVCDPLTKCLAPRLSRSLASQTSLPVTELAQEIASAQFSDSAPSQYTRIPSPRVLTTLHQWPQMEPTRFVSYNENELNIPLRKDILHRAVIFEADGSRQGTASAKWRGAVHGSNRKIAPQKGLGRARVGDKKSPIRRGGGKAHGPHPRDFSTDLPRKVYDLAWRTALSHRYRKGELIVLENCMTLPEHGGGRFLSNFFEANQWGQGNGRSLLVPTDAGRLHTHSMMEAMTGVGMHGMMKDVWDVDVKDLLETGRVIIEKGALDTILLAHASDLGNEASLKFAFEAKGLPFLHESHNLQNWKSASGSLRNGDKHAMLEETADEDDFEMEDEFEVGAFEAENSQPETR